MGKRAFAVAVPQRPNAGNVGAQLIIDDSNSPLPTLDSTRLLARAALAWAIGTEAELSAAIAPSR